MKKWYENWVEVFKIGTHTDSKGITRTWSKQDLDAIVSNYNENNEEAPVVIGHPTVDAPAFGWVEKIKRENDRLLVKFKKIIPEFVRWVDDGLYRKISVAINPDNSLRHVGFLGATPPAVKGLQHSFGNGESYFTYENTITALKDGIIPSYAEHEGSEFASLQRDYNGLISQNRRLETRSFVLNLCREGKINPAYSQILEDILCQFEAAPSNMFSDGSENPGAQLREFLSSLSPRCTFGELATTGPKKQLSPETEIGLRIARSL